MYDQVADQATQLADRIEQRGGLDELLSIESVDRAVRSADRKENVVGDRPDGMRYETFDHVHLPGVSRVNPPTACDRPDTAHGNQQVVTDMRVRRERLAGHEPDDVDAEVLVRDERLAGRVCTDHPRRQLVHLDCEGLRRFRQLDTLGPRSNLEAAVVMLEPRARSSPARIAYRSDCCGVQLQSELPRD